VSPEIRKALLFPDDYQIENRILIAALIAANRSRGVQLLEACEVKRVIVQAGKVTGVETTQGNIHAPVVVMAAGAWSSTIDTPAAIAVEPIRGQMLCFGPGAGFAGASGDNGLCGQELHLHHEDPARDSPYQEGCGCAEGQSQAAYR
jgi:glycine/D-amino acid oxidase-like deaminating enzyme